MLKPFSLPSLFSASTSRFTKPLSLFGQSTENFALKGEAKNSAGHSSERSISRLRVCVLNPGEWDKTYDCNNVEIAFQS
ncbi:hypothetical protein D3C72_1345940 [compost metagenome]